MSQTLRFPPPSNPEISPSISGEKATSVTSSSLTVPFLSVSFWPTAFPDSDKPVLPFSFHFPPPVPSQTSTPSVSPDSSFNFWLSPSSSHYSRSGDLADSLSSVRGATFAPTPSTSTISNLSKLHNWCISRRGDCHEVYEEVWGKV